MKKIIITAFIATSLSACETINVGNGFEFDSEVVCGAAGKTSCSPTVGRKVPLKKQKIPIEISQQGLPVLQSYLGTVVGHKNRRGEPGAYCGGSKAFTPQDFTGPLVTNRGDFVEDSSSRGGTDLNANLKEALNLAGVQDEVLNRLDSSIVLEANRYLSTNVTAKANFVEYRIKDSVLKELETHTNSGRFANCLAELRTGKWRL